MAVTRRRPGQDPALIAALRGEAAIRQAVLEALRAYRASLDTEKLAAAIDARDWIAAIDSADMQTLKDGLARAFVPIAAVYKESAANGAASISELLRKAGHIREARRLAYAPRAVTIRKADPDDPYAFEILDDDIAAQLRAYQDQLIVELTQEVRQFVYDTTISGVRAGLDSTAVAATVRDRIGLTSRLAMAVANYRAALERNDTGISLDRQLRDFTADAEVAAAAAPAGTRLSQQRIDQLVEAYAQRALDYRAMTIAQTESVRAANRGLHQSYMQAVTQGVFPHAAVTRYWRLGSNPCPICIAIEALNTDGVAVDADFVSPDGPIDNPPVHPSCYCSVEYITDLDMLR